MKNYLFLGQTKNWRASWLRGTSLDETCRTSHLSSAEKRQIASHGQDRNKEALTHSPEDLSGGFVNNSKAG